jgi:hypothetical protein
MEAVIEGFWAGVRGDSPQLNPYPKMTREHRDWMRWQGIAIEAFWR